ncbi:MAG: DUF4870 domain-containing protein, partial [Anaerolineaceae bacterium]|nr:DUF4870 domain-containing protein [Anaerolineaceae bacterium]
MESQTYPTPEETTSDDKLWALLAYLLSPLVPVILLLMEDKKNRPFIRAHTVQALIWGVLAYGISALLSPILGLGCVIWIVYLILTILWALKAYKGE